MTNLLSLSSEAQWLLFSKYLIFLSLKASLGVTFVVKNDTSMSL
jgi:hypothetical protein